MYGQEVCLFGDSIARGIILDAQGSYKPIKECFASLAASELGFGLINKARFGCTITKGREIIEHFLSRVDSETRRLAFLEFGGNDCDFRWDQISADPHAEHLPATTPERFFRMYSEVIQELKNKGFRPVLIDTPASRRRTLFRLVHAHRPRSKGHPRLAWRRPVYLPLA